MRRLNLSFAILGVLFWASCVPTKTNCNDGVDNDDDGLVDDEDPGCPFNAGNTEAPNPEQCDDGIDNDGDTLIDLEDWGCEDGKDRDETDPILACNNGLDDDGDGKTDYGSDLGCETPIDEDEANTPACADGVDNDNDAFLDYPFDPGCEQVTDDDETDPAVPPGCYDQVDNDGDTFIDYPNDQGCTAAGDPDEFNATFGECGPTVPIAEITVLGEVTGSMTTASPNELISSVCPAYGGEQAFTFHVSGTNSALLISTDYPETTLDTVVYVRSACRDQATELGCNDDAVAGNKRSTLVVPSAPAGDYFIVVDAFSPGSLGNFKLTVQERVGLGGTCDPAATDPCVPGLICRELTPGAGHTCQYHLCGDMADNDGDGDIDFPFDPGCTSNLDDDETDPSPVPACGNGADDDADARVDYPADPGCDYAADGSEIDECVPGAPVLDHPGGSVSGNTSGAPSLLSAPATCDPFAGTGMTSERVYAYNNTRQLASLNFSTAGSSFDTFLYVRYQNCAIAGPGEYCSDDAPGTFNTSIVTIPNPPLGTYFAIVDGEFGTVGAFTLAVGGEIAGGQPCTAGDANFVCTSGYACSSGTCRPTACNDGTDNDGDGRADAADPGCSSSSDPDETPDPSPAPQCANGVDDDGDTLIDFPSDLGCARASDTTEVDCTDSDPVADVTHSGGTFTGTTAGKTNDASGQCDFSTYGGSSPDVAHVLRLPGRTTVTIGLCGGSLWDSVLYVKADCTTPTAALCDDDGCDGATETKSIIRNQVLNAGTWFVYVDGYFGDSAGDYTMTITGTVADGELCDPAQMVTGFLSCNAGKSCTNTGSGFRCQ